MLIKREIVDNVPVGLYLVMFDTIWGNHCNPGKHDDCLEHGCLDREPEYIAEIEPNVVKITKSNYLKLTENVLDKDETLNSKTDFSDDTHDLRPRLFKTKSEAEEHAKFTLNRFTNPQPWECFVKTA